MKPEISVIFCTHNPQIEHLARVLLALKLQHLFLEQWELIIVDSASNCPLTDGNSYHYPGEHNCTYPYSNYSTGVDIHWHTQARIVREKEMGLAAARLRGFQEAEGDLLVFVNEDNVLDPNYLLQVQRIFQTHPGLGAIAGKSTPEFEVNPEPWIAEFYNVLALRDFGDHPLMTAECQLKQPVTRLEPPTYPEFAPAGIGLAVRRSAFASYADRITGDALRLTFGRTGSQLTSGEDNDIILTLMSTGWQVGYFPQLQLTHLIPAKRLERNYLAKLNYASSRSWVQVLDVHRIRTWQKIPAWTVLPRKVKAFLMYQPWRNAAAYVRWWGACGMYEGLASLSDSTISQ